MGDSPDRPLFSNFLRSTAASASALAASSASIVSEGVASLLEPDAASRAAEAAAEADRAGGMPPWCTLSEQFAILEEELKRRILLIPHEGRFDAAAASQRRRPGNILPGCLPMATAALAGDDALRALRFRLVPAALSEEDFWRCYFWHVAQIKCELCNDWSTANAGRRTAAREDEASLAAAPDDEPAGAASPRAAPPADPDELDAEFERLVAPSPGA